MSTIRGIVELVDQLRENAIPQELKVRWIGELDALIALEVMKLDVLEAEQFQYDAEADMERSPLVRFPHDNIYHYWLCAKIDAENGEYNRYQNTMQLYNGAFQAYRTWFSRVYDVFNQGRGAPSFYISAYGLAVQQGYPGTLDEWLLSLVGPQGPQGIQGIQGEPGNVFDELTPEQLERIRGPQGIPGPQGEQGVQGPKGDTGKQGPQGEQGVQGIQGEKGDSGEKGEQGPQGPQGIQGETGATGPQGPQGPRGIQGEIGPQGPQGPEGPQGPKGEDGTMTFENLTDEQKASLKGDKGDKGDSGASVTVKSVSQSSADGGSNVVIFSDGNTVTIKNGSKGSKGDKGDQGVQGEKGDAGATGAKGDKGDPGSDATVTKANVSAALGYTPADETAVSLLTPIISTTDITAGSAASDGRPYHVIE